MTATERKNRLRAGRLAEGRCPDCGGRPAVGRTRCKECLAKLRAYNAERQARLARKKVCVCCGAEKAERGKRYGLKCKRRFAAYQRAYSAAAERELDEPTFLAIEACAAAMLAEHAD